MSTTAQALAAIAGVFLLAGAGPGVPRLKLPAPEYRTGGTVALADMADDGAERSVALADAMLGGDMPDFVRKLVPVRYDAEDAMGAWHTVEVWVTPDYLSIGNDHDWVYAPLGYPSARRVARQLNAFLPTSQLSDRIHAAAVKLEPEPIPPSSAMRTTAVLLDHQHILEAELPPAGQLVAGHKKDVVLDAKLAARPDRVAIYGWHHPDGTPIQPVSLWHGLRYADYSHGVRLVSRTARVDGRITDLGEVMTDPVLYALVSGDPLPQELVDTFEFEGLAVDERPESPVVYATMQ